MNILLKKTSLVLIFTIIVTAFSSGLSVPAHEGKNSNTKKIFSEIPGPESIDVSTSGQNKTVKYQGTSSGFVPFINETKIQSHCDTISRITSCPEFAIWSRSTFT